MNAAITPLRRALFPPTLGAKGKRGSNRSIKPVCGLGYRASTLALIGVTDAVLLEVASPTRPLITVDLDLYAAAGHDRAINFTYHQQL